MVDLSEADSYSIATFFMGGNSGRNEGGDGREVEEMTAMRSVLAAGKVLETLTTGL